MDAAARAATALVRADLLRAEDPMEFTHPVVRTAIYQQIGADERSRAHRRAGELLLQAGAPAEQAASHLLLTLPAGDRFVTATLCRAAERSLAEGSAPVVRRRFRAQPSLPTDCLQRTSRLLALVHPQSSTRRLVSTQKRSCPKLESA